MKTFPVKIHTIKLEATDRKLDPAWKIFNCPRCGGYAIYKGKPPKHDDCPGEFKVIILGGPEAEKKLIRCMASEIRKEIKKKISDVKKKSSKMINRMCSKIKQEVIEELDK